MINGDHCSHPRGKRDGHIRSCRDCGRPMSATCQDCRRTVKLLPDGNLWRHGTLNGQCTGTMTFRHDAADVIDCWERRNAARFSAGFPPLARPKAKEEW